MIYLITGKPGNGKTLFALWWVEKVLRAFKDKDGRKFQRPVFYARVSGIAEAKKLNWQIIDPFEWYKAPAGAIVVIDEVQHSADPTDPKSPTLFGVRQRGAPVPIWAQKLETHRHAGIDLVLITQDPMLMDSHDRKLVGTHYHVKRSFGMQRAVIHKFNGCKPNVDQSTSGSETNVWKFPKEVFTWYQSAEVHTHRTSIPARVWLFLAIPVFVAGLSYWAWVKYLDPEAAAAKPVSQANGQPAQPGAATPQTPRMTREEYIENHAPRIPGLAYTAPIYDDVTKPVRAPYPAGCVRPPGKPDDCQCYTSQGTRLATPKTTCTEILERGFFVFWNEPPTPSQPMKNEPPPQPETARVGSLGGGKPMGFVRREGSEATP